MANVNYQKELEKIIEKIQQEDKIPRLLLHSCCAPCSSYVLEYLSEYFEITVFYYNPNISSKEEYEKRVEEQRRLIEAMETRNKVTMVQGEYCPQKFFSMTKGLEDIPEGGERCFLCYRMRLEETARVAAREGYDYFTSTLTISPLKNAGKLNEIGQELAGIWQVPHLPSDFKKKNGYLRSIELSEKYGLYRQNYCGCSFSKKEALARQEKKFLNFF